MRIRANPIAALAIALVVVACGSTTPTARPTTSATRSATAAPVPTDAIRTEAPTPALTPVPGGASDDPVPPPFNPGTTETDWGRILDAVPDDFPFFPGASPAELPEGPNSGAWIAEASVDDVVDFYQGALQEAGFTIDNLSSPLEDGSRVLDIRTDLPECRIQLTFRPADGSTMIIVLYGAGCVAGDF